MGKLRKSTINFDDDSSSDNNEQMKLAENNSQSAQDAGKVIKLELTPESNSDQKFNPLNNQEGVKKREYAQQVGVTSEPEVERVAEPVLNNMPPPPNKNAAGGANGGNGGGGGQQTFSSVPPNPDLVNMPTEDKVNGATMLVDLFLFYYQAAWDFGYSKIEVNETKLSQLVLEGKISPDITIPYNERGDEISIKEIYQMFNLQAYEKLHVDLKSDEFVKVRQYMIEEFAVRGWGISRIQYILAHFGKDIVSRTQGIFTLNNKIGEFTKAVQNKTLELNKIKTAMTDIRENVRHSEPEVMHKATQTVEQVRSNVQSHEHIVEQDVDKIENQTIKMENFIQKHEIQSDKVVVDPTLEEKISPSSEPLMKKSDIEEAFSVSEAENKIVEPTIAARIEETKQVEETKSESIADIKQTETTEPKQKDEGEE